MQERKTFSELITEGHQYLLPLPLPPAKGVRPDRLGNDNVIESPPLVSSAEADASRKG